MMRKSLAILVLPLLLAGCHPSQSVVEAFSSGSPPVLDSVTPKGGTLADFRIHSADGNVVVLHREVTDSVVPRAPVDASVDIDPERQKVGASFSEGWSCQGEKGRQTIRAYLIDGNHHHSNMVDYTVDCGG
jgi:hypothetical protein